jgi:hypothetical protein
MKKNLLLLAGLFGAVLLGGCQKEEESVFTLPPTLAYDASQIKPFYKVGDTIKMSIAVQPNSTQLLKRVEVTRVYGSYNPESFSGEVHEWVNFEPFVEKCNYSLFHVVTANDINQVDEYREPDGSVKLTFALNCVAANLEGEMANNPVSVLLKKQ